MLEDEDGFSVMQRRLLGETIEASQIFPGNTSVKAHEEASIARLTHRRCSDTRWVTLAPSRSSTSSTRMATPPPTK